MGDYLGCHTLSHESLLASMRMAMHGALFCLLINGSPVRALVTAGAETHKARGWFRYVGKKYAEIGGGPLQCIEHLRLALTDDSDDCTWVFGHGIERSQISHEESGASIACSAASFGFGVSEQLAVVAGDPGDGQCCFARYRVA